MMARPIARLGDSVPGLRAAVIAALALACAAGASTAAAQPAAPASSPAVASAPADAPVERGRIAWYGRKFAGRPTASGEAYDPEALTMARRVRRRACRGLRSCAGQALTLACRSHLSIVPLVLTFLKKFVGQNNLDAGSLATLLRGQGPHLAHAVDSRLTGALGYASPAAFVNSIGGTATDTAKRAAAAVASGAGSMAGAASTAVAQARSPFMRYLPWLIAAAVLLFLWNLFAGRSTPPSAPASVPAPTAAPAMPSWIAPTLASAKVYFDVGSSTIGADGQKTIAAMADLIKKESAKVGITGYTDRTGDAAKNEELAKNRALAVRDALKAAGVAESSLELKAPAFVETGTGGNLAEARRVEINKP